ncbi:outer membrane beta-barrel family protein [Mucilaginibacter sp. UR6-11]|uniref:outer membrane beta-barrel family protein n=1 Tax=Mucilaginibacter sp. UR6-11 TaxID=1435644 RepID=UPI001E4A0261|nr:outer membrane beta-barrel family protein [Mucilaginibacter sp. UR6-11]MCC8424681.1 TonB-dependent receptor [Mucilaginibacter sp. UR6-11]
MKLKTTLTLLLWCVGVYASLAQSTAGSNIKGRLIDSVTRQPAEFVTVALKDLNNQQLKTVVGKMDGTFTISDVKPGKFIISFTLVGYTGKSININTDGNRPLDLGDVVISASATQIKAVAIKANRPVIKQEADRITYDIQADATSKFNNVLEMMRKVPLLTVDAEDNIQLSGSPAYRIFINGKPSSLLERNPKDVLKSMPASSIQKIEVITTPSSKYDAEGLAGIINIITNKTIDDGYNANININERFPAGGQSVGGSFTTKSGKFGLSAFGGGGLANNPVTTNDVLRTSKDLSSALFQSGDRKSDNQNAYLGVELSYEIDSLNLISGQFNVNGSKGTGRSSQNSVLGEDAAITQRYDLLTDNDNNGKGADLAVNYQKGYRRNKNQLTTFSYRYYGFANNQNAGQLFNNRVNYALPDFRQANKSVMSEHTVQLDHVYPLNKINIEAGLKAIIRFNESDFQYLAEDSGGNYLADPSKTNTFNNRQTILAGYNSYQYTINNWSLKAGVRVEYTDIAADFMSTASQVSQKYFNVVPAVALSRRFKTTGISFGWNQRIQRPGINQLNPFVDRSNPTFETSGNPDLRPTTGNQVRFGFDWGGKGNLFFNLQYNWIKGLIFPVSSYDEVTNITRTRFENTGTAKALGTNINFNYPLTQTWNVSLNGGLAHGWATGVSNGQPIRNHGFMFNANLTSGLKLNNGWRTGINIYVNGGQLTVQQQSNAYISTSFNMSKDIIKDKLTFSAFTNNPYKRYRINTTHSFGPNFDQVSHDQQNFSSFGASLSYKLGKLKESIKKNKRGISNDDISN